MSFEDSASQFASAHRQTPEEIRAQRDSLAESMLLRAVVDAIPNVLVILNEDRQIVLANQAMATMLGIENFSDIYGLRPGEAVDCIHAGDNDAGCGTTEFCRTCGAVNAILSAQKGQADTRECHILQKTSGKALDLRITASPFIHDGHKYTVFVVNDMESENRRRALERVFFHDVMNTAGGMQSAIKMMAGGKTQDRQSIEAIAQRLSERLVEEIQTHRDLRAAENDELEPRRQICDPRTLLENTADLYRSHHLAKGRVIRVEVPAGGRGELISDVVLLGRILGNMVKNALEASSPGEVIRLGYDVQPEHIEFWVNNSAVMPRDVQLQMFHRSFSTKGHGRGLGAYSLKLLGERYLGGQVRFTSIEGEGTTFFARFPRALPDRPIR